MSNLSLKIETRRPAPPSAALTQGGSFAALSDFCTLAAHGSRWYCPGPSAGSKRTRRGSPAQCVIPHKQKRQVGKPLETAQPLYRALTENMALNSETAGAWLARYKYAPKHQRRQANFARIEQLLETNTLSRRERLDYEIVLEKKVVDEMVDGLKTAYEEFLEGLRRRLGYTSFDAFSYFLSHYVATRPDKLRELIGRMAALEESEKRVLVCANY